MKRMTRQPLDFQQRMAAIRRQRIVARNQPTPRPRVSQQRRIPVVRAVDFNAAIKLAIDNDQGTYSDVQAMVADSADAYDFSDQLRAYFDEIYGDESQNLGSAMAELLGSAYRDINWDTLAQEMFNAQ